MTVEYVRYRIDPEQQPSSVEAIHQVNQLPAIAPDCLNYQLAHCEEEPTLFIWRIEWASVEQHLNGFRKSPEFRLFFSW
ncbi:putative quinol monooxygenase [Hymenobacter sediminis]|uniref:putative quinol monooxygenase n=1 Tax=Hymenobacter sediminis TaxID=2218621 RepID=UPI00192E31AF|nr:antibiotic biosynthesis monooxygenase [Hymenobacter sediminis]